MRTRYIFSAALLVLASASVAGAQQKTAAPAKPAWEQTWELGFRATTTTGDEARYQRYEDLKSGLASKIMIGKDDNAVGYDFSAANVGYDDQRYSFSYNRYGKAKFTLDFNGQPLNYAYNTLTPFRDAGNNKWTLDQALRTRVQNKEAGVVGIGTNAATNVASIYRSIATEFPMSAQRNTLDMGLKYQLNSLAAFDLSYKMVQKSGNQPWGAAFAFNNAQELPMTLDNGVNEITAGIEFAKNEYGMIRAEYQGSFFKQNLASMEWDSPLRVTDFDNGKLPPAGPWDPSGYSNGNGPAFGRMSMTPSSQMNSLMVTALYKMPNHTTLNGQFAMIRMTQDDDLLPFTTNTKIAQPATYAFFPGLSSLRRPTAEGQVDALNAVINFTTRPTDYFAFDMKYRFNDHDNVTPEWNGEYNVRFDAVPEYVPGSASHGLDVRQSTVETGATFTLPSRGTALRVGYILDDVKRSGRAFSDMTDYTFRASLDAYRNQYVSLRGLVESTRRIGSGLSIEHIEEGGGQDALRFYDEADMDRIKSSVILGLTPSSKFDFNLSLGTMNDEYTGEGHEFGMLKYDNTSFSVTGNFYANDKVTFGAMYGADNWSSNQKSRNANPLGTVPGAYESWNDPKRDWYLDNDETITSAGVWVDLIQALPRTDVRFAFNFSDSDLEYNYNGPRVEAMKNPDNAALRDPRDARACSGTIASCFIPWPNVTNSWSQVKVDLRHMFKDNLGIGLGYRYEKFEVVDFATTDVTPGEPRMDPLGAITTGYGNRPFTGSTAVVKLIYKF
ncbi:MAG: MtrB/PioB family outer membrane beta-barrel protein [Gemmatimonadetes bacterium]|nr:MtrB/PioB family outer membrane beta-barrel protein [Gemmatimonadota bacterium]